MKNSTNERIYIDLGFKLTNSMSFGESLFSAGLFQKTTKRDLFVKGKLGIKIRHIRDNTLKDMRRHQNKARGEELPWGRPKMINSCSTIIPFNYLVFNV
jgi:hypothetical protein